ncbi:Thiol:disulfide interchange protein DsbC [Candidatus Burkholderia verschuerenii]|uniref:Thiol:disulfide interchange protein n=1 Tax=Candidatus Burkholderia verschuerenii TaxID=242163 RepID=A0A0L0MFP1_9BURK|nr:DsbC family protein [Candidatus Burkholderia verschuerenii]KND61116.1 Thiol:disulfide interchange protein DsbC [Candidatus Burkholderia verschuerenii]
MRARWLALSFVLAMVIGIAHAQDRRIDFASLPLGHAIESIHGTGARRIAVFEDPYCPFYRRLERELQALDDVTVYVFLFPILTPQSRPMSDAIWCAPDRARAWQTWMIEGRAPDAARSCGTSPAADNLALAARLDIRITPTIVFADGTLVTGALPLDDLQAMLNGARP